MAGMDEYDWRDYQDFTGGLWQRGNDRECAPNGLLECQDCFPQPGGGLKAFAEFKPISAPFASGASPVTAANVLGIWANPGRPPMLMVIEGAAPSTVRMYAFSSASLPTEAELSGGSGAEWVATLSRTDVTSINSCVRMERFRDAASGYVEAFNLPANTGTSTGGIWQSGTTAGSATFLFAPLGDRLPTGLWSHQARLLTLNALGGAVDTRLVYTDPASVAAPSTVNYILPFGEQASPMKALFSASPSDLVFFKDEYCVGTIQGSITAPLVRQSGGVHIRVRGFPTNSPIGLVFVVMNEGAYVWSGQEPEHLSPQILGDAMGGNSWDATLGSFSATTNELGDFDGALWTVASARSMTTGQLGCYEHWVFFNNGYVLDTRTGAWFTQTSAPRGRYWSPNLFERRMYVAAGNAFVGDSTTRRPSPDVLYWSRMGESSWVPSQTYSFTLPLVETPSQRVNLRELEYELYAYNAESTIEVEVTSPEKTLDTLGPYTLDANASSVRIVVPGHPAEWYKVRTILKSNRSGEEAPLMSKMRVGTQGSTRTAVNR